MARKTIYNKITNEENIENINEKNKELCGLFIEYLESVDRAPLTIRGYKNDLDIFFCWNLEHNKNKSFIDMKRMEFSRFQGYAMREWNWSPKRIKRVRAALSSLSTFIENMLKEEDDEYEDFVPIISKIQPPKNKPVREKTVLSDDTIDEYLEQLVKEGRYQQACALSLAALSGARKAELLLFKVSFFDESNIYIKDSLYRTPKIRAKGSGKDGKQIEKYVLYDFKQYFDLWMEQRKKLGIDSEWLFVRYEPETNTYERMKQSTLNSWSRRFSKDLGVDFYWHCLRHYLTTKMKKYNIPDHIIKEFFKWESVEMVDIYSDLEASEDFDKYFNKDGMIEGKSGSLSDM